MGINLSLIPIFFWRKNANLIHSKLGTLVSLE